MIFRLDFYKIRYQYLRLQFAASLRGSPSLNYVAPDSESPLGFMGYSPERADEFNRWN